MSSSVPWEICFQHMFGPILRKSGEIVAELGPEMMRLAMDKRKMGVALSCYQAVPSCRISTSGIPQVRERPSKQKLCGSEYDQFRRFAKPLGKEGMRGGKVSRPADPTLQDPPSVCRIERILLSMGSLSKHIVLSDCFTATSKVCGLTACSGFSAVMEVPVLGAQWNFHGRALEMRQFRYGAPWGGNGTAWCGP